MGDDITLMQASLTHCYSTNPIIVHSRLITQLSSNHTAYDIGFTVKVHQHAVSRIPVDSWTSLKSTNVSAQYRSTVLENNSVDENRLLT